MIAACRDEELYTPGADWRGRVIEKLCVFEYYQAVVVSFVLSKEASMPNSGVVGNTIKLVGEIIVPGASLLVDGNIKYGVGHLVVGLVAGALLGPLGLAVVNVNSFAQSVSDKNLFDHTADIFSFERLRPNLPSSARSGADGGG
jgi:Family of unknown function (DUF6072)